MVTVEISEHDGQGFICIEQGPDFDPEEARQRRCKGCGETLTEKTRLAMPERDARRLRAILNVLYKD